MALKISPPGLFTLYHDSHKLLGLKRLNEVTSNRSLMEETDEQRSQGQRPVDEAERHKQRNKKWLDEHAAVSHMIPGYRSLYKKKRNNQVANSDW